MVARKLLIVTALVETATGLLLLVTPQLVIAFLLGAQGVGAISLGFLITGGILLLLGLIGGLLALRFFRRGSPPTPELAIEEAKKTRAAIEEVSRS